MNKKLDLEVGIIKNVYDSSSINKIRENIIKNNISMKDGFIKANTLPGLGIDVDENYLNEIKI